jgi:hypothetical protein
MRYASYHKKFLPSFGADKAFDWIVPAITAVNPDGLHTDFRLLECIFKVIRADPGALVALDHLSQGELVGNM